MAFLNIEWQHCFQLPIYILQACRDVNETEQMLIGNKCDNEDYRAVDANEGEKVVTHEYIKLYFLLENILSL